MYICRCGTSPRHEGIDAFILSAQYKARWARATPLPITAGFWGGAVVHVEAGCKTTTYMGGIVAARGGGEGLSEEAGRFGQERGCRGS